MTPTIGFLTFLAITIFFLVLAVITGLSAMRKWHLACVASAVIGLIMAVQYAYDLGSIYDLDAAGWITPFHLWLAKIATGLYLLPVITGIRTMFVPATRRWHRKAAFFVLALTALSAITGAWMLIAAPIRVA
jgi:hypothetical protein